MKTKTLSMTLIMIMMSLTTMGQSAVTSTSYEQKTMKGKMGYSLRISPQFGMTYTDLTIGYHLTDKSLLGLALGHGSGYDDAVPADYYHWHIMAFYHYGKQIKKSRFSLYSDFMVGGAYYYKVTADTDMAKKGDIDLAISWQPGIAFRLFKNAKIFLGPAILPNVGIHAGISYGM